MYEIVVGFACLAQTCHGQQVQRTEKSVRNSLSESLKLVRSVDNLYHSQPLAMLEYLAGIVNPTGAGKALAELLLAFNSVVAFNPSCCTAHLSRHNRIPERFLQVSMSDDLMPDPRAVMDELLKEEARLKGQDRDDLSEEVEPEMLVGQLLEEDTDGTDGLFEETFDPSFSIPPRLCGKDASMVGLVNPWLTSEVLGKGGALLNDMDRNEFYQNALRAVVAPDKLCLEIGAGVGLLSMIAAKEGGGRVVAVEETEGLVNVAQQTVAANGLADKVQLVNKISTDVTVEQDLAGQRADVLVSDVLGTILLGNGALEYVSDARQRLLAPDAVIIPAFGTQFATLIESEAIESTTRVTTWGRHKLQSFNQLQDTVLTSTTREYGFRMSKVGYHEMSERFPVFDVDFYKDNRSSLPTERRFRIRALRSGTVQAVMLTWDVWADCARERKMSTDPKETLDNFPRDMHWGQALQLVEDTGAADNGDSQPVPLVVKEGEDLDVMVKILKDGIDMQFLISKVSRV